MNSTAFSTKIKGRVQVTPTAWNPEHRQGVLWFQFISLAFEPIDVLVGDASRLAMLAAARAGSWLLSQGWPRPAARLVGAEQRPEIVELVFRVPVPASAIEALTREVIKAAGRAQR